MVKGVFFFLLLEGWCNNGKGIFFCFLLEGLCNNGTTLEDVEVSIFQIDSKILQIIIVLSSIHRDDQHGQHFKGISLELLSACYTNIFSFLTYKLHRMYIFTHVFIVWASKIQLQIHLPQKYIFSQNFGTQILCCMATITLHIRNVEIKTQLNGVFMSCEREYVLKTTRHLLFHVSKHFAEPFLSLQNTNTSD